MIHQKKVVFGKPNVAGIFTFPDGEGPFPAVIITHGFSSRKEGFIREHTSTGLAKNGIASLNIDLFGHGESEGAFEDITVTKTIKNMQDAVAFLQEQENIDDERIGLNTSSFSGYASIVGIEKLKNIKALVLRSPADGVSERWSKQFDFDEWKQKGYAYYESKAQDKSLKINYHFVEDASTYDLDASAKTIDCPTLIIHGDKDEIIPVKHAQHVFELLQGEKKLEIVKDCMHHYDRPEEKEKAITLTINWLVQHLT